MEELFTPQKIVALNYVAVVPVVLWYLKNVTGWKYLFFGAIFIINFSRGTLELLGISSTITRLTIELLILLLLVIQIVANRKVRLDGIKYHFLLLIICILSAAINDIKLQVVIGFFRDYWMMFLFFYILLNSNFTRRDIKLLNKLLVFLFLSQIFANFIKIYLVGITEPYIGTISVRNGSITTVVVLLGISYSLINYLYTGKRIYIIVILGFLLFGIIGGKRVILFLVPLIILTTSFLFYIYNRSIKSFVKLFGSSIIAIILIVYIIIRTIPSLNPDNKLWGKFDFGYALNYSREYAMDTNQTTGAGRLTTPSLVFKMLYSSDLDNLLFGFGTGHLVRSSFNESLIDKNVFETTQSLYGRDIGYGSGTGLLQVLMQIGLFGLTIYIITIYQMFKSSIKNFANKQASFNKLFSVSSFIIMLLIFVIYSTTSVILIPMGMVFAWIFATNNFKYHKLKSKIIISKLPLSSDFRN